MAASRGRPSSLVPEDTSGVIRVRVLEGRNLKACDLNSKSDPYVKLHTGSPTAWDKSGKYKTKVVSSTLDPVWNQTFEISLKNPARQGLRFVVRDRDVGSKDDKMGEAHFLQTNKLILGEEVDCWLPVMLKDKQRGDLRVKITALDFGLLPPRAPISLGLAIKGVLLLKQNDYWNKYNYECSGSSLKLFVDLSVVSFDINLSNSTTINEADLEDDEHHRHIAALTTVAESSTAKWVLAFGSETERDWFISKIDKIIQKGTMGEVSGPVQGPGLSLHYLHTLWSELDTEGRSFLKYRQVEELVNWLNLHLSTSALQAMFAKVDTNHNGELDFDEFCHLIVLLRVRPDITLIWSSLTSSSTLSTSSFASFLKNTQKVDISEDELRQLIHTLEGNPNATELTITGFANYLSSHEHNCAYDRKAAHEIYHDMNQPITHYFISSSHNTYLTGDQLYSKSSPDMYTKVLTEACRCVELDVWDGDSGSEPIVYHGHTLTSKITFREAVQAIKDSAFTATSSPFPVILSLETHCGAEGQRKMGNILKTILADSLIDGFDPHNTLLASANDLRGKFLIKTKRNASDPDDFKDMVEDDIAAAINSEDTAHSDEPSQTFSVGTLLKAQSGSLSSVGSKKDKDKLKPSSSSSNISTPDTKTKKTVHEVARELSELVHLGTSGFKGFDDTSKRHYDWYCWSFSEGAATSRAKTSSNYIDWNRTHMSRIYPAGNRFDSSNYNPQPFWNTGCQVVALNWQTFDRSTRLNEAFFMDNGGCGYMLKPASLLSTPIVRDPNLIVSPKCILRLTVISAWQLPKSANPKSQKLRKGEVSDPYVRIIMSGVSLDCKKEKTSVISNNGFNPVWQQQFTFELRDPELAVLMFEVYNSDSFSKNDFLGYAGMPVRLLKRGYRHVQLKAKDRSILNEACLMIHIELEDLKQSS